MKKIITNAAGEVKLGGTLLPGVYDSMEVSGAVRIDEKDVPGSSGARKQPLGFEDAVVTLRLRLLTDENTDCYEKVAILTGLFQKVDTTAKPYIYRIVNRLLDAWKIKEVLYSTLRTADDNKSDSIRADLEFIEYRPVLVNAEAKAATPALKSKVVLPPSQGVGDLKVSEAADSFNLASSAAGEYSDAGTRVAKTVATAAVDDDVLITV